MNNKADTVQAEIEKFRTSQNPHQHKARVAANDQMQPKGGNEAMV